MLISELYEETREQYVQRLTTSLNIERLGHGRYGEVFQHPTMPDVAVKIFGKDRSYSSYLKFCMKNQSNKYIPKIIGQEVSELDDGKILNIVFLEKLKPAEDASVRKFIWYALSLVNKDELTYKLRDDYRSLRDFGRQVWRLLSAQTADKDLAVFAKYFLGVINSASFTPDLHNKNVMFRSNQLVFVDPAS